MKKLLVTVCMLLAATPYIKAQAALQQGAIAYDMTINLREQVAKKNPAVAALVPKEIHLRMTVSFKNEVFAVTSEEVDSRQPAQNTSLRVAAGADDKKIVDLKKRVVRGEHTINGKKYYTEGTLQPSKAIVYTKETKKLLGYTVTKAIITSEDKKYTVWFTSQIPNSYSPEADLFAGLKGTVLEYSTDEYNCRAVSINPNGFKPAAIATDATARRITEEQLQDLKEDAAGEQVKSTTTKGSGGNRQVTEKVFIKL